MKYFPANVDSMNVALAWWAAIVVALAGCTSGGDTTLQSSQEPSATPEAAVARVIVTVVDDQEAPIAGATVAIVETEATELTDGAGRVEFVGVSPGTYRVIVERLGYDTTAKQVSVVQGATMELTIGLLPIAIEEEPVLTVLSYEGIIQCSVNPVWPVNPCNGVTGQDTSRFFVKLDLDLKWKETILEAEWTPTTAATAQDLEVDLCDNNGDQETLMLCDDSNWVSYSSGASPLRTGTASPFTGSPSIGPTTVIELGIGDSIGSGSPVFQQKFTFWLTHCYIGECPDDHSALPPA